jgi:hypothetical protein
MGMKARPKKPTYDELMDQAKDEAKVWGHCVDCNAEMNEGEAKTFTVCDDCWAKSYPQSMVDRVRPAYSAQYDDFDDTLTLSLDPRVRLKVERAGVTWYFFDWAHNETGHKAELRRFGGKRAKA